MAEKKYNIVVGIGHEQNSPGASGNGISEFHYNFKLAEKIKTALTQLGKETYGDPELHIYLSNRGELGTKDYYINGTKTGGARNVSRETTAINNFFIKNSLGTVDAFINLHCNKSPSSKNDYYRVIYNGGSPGSLNLCRCIVKRCVTDSRPFGSYSNDDIDLTSLYQDIVKVGKVAGADYVNKEFLPNSVLLENFFLSNPKQVEKAIANIDACAIAIAQGILDFCTGSIPQLSDSDILTLMNDVSLTRVSDKLEPKFTDDEIKQSASETASKALKLERQMGNGNYSNMVVKNRVLITGTSSPAHIPPFRTDPNGATFSSSTIRDFGVVPKETAYSTYQMIDIGSMIPTGNFEIVTAGVQTINSYQLNMSAVGVASLSGGLTSIGGANQLDLTGTNINMDGGLLNVNCGVSNINSNTINMNGSMNVQSNLLCAGGIYCGGGVTTPGINCVAQIENSGETQVLVNPTGMIESDGNANITIPIKDLELTITKIILNLLNTEIYSDNVTFQLKTPVKEGDTVLAGKLAISDATLSNGASDEGSISLEGDVYNNAGDMNCAVEYNIDNMTGDGGGAPMITDSHIHTYKRPQGELSDSIGDMNNTASADFNAAATSCKLVAQKISNMLPGVN